jgi:hypothetical protein
MEGLEDFFNLILFLLFLGALFGGGFYMGYRYRDSISQERQKKYRPSRSREVSRAPAPTHNGPAEAVE